MQPTTYYKRNQGRITANLRRTRLTTKDGQVIRGLTKRPHPGHCEWCHKGKGTAGKPVRLAYHHWNDKAPSMGLWLCATCHFVAEFMDLPQAMEIILLYNRLKDTIEEEYATSTKPGS